MKTGGGLAPPSGGQSLKGLNAASIAAIVASAVLLGGGLVLGGSWLWLRRSQCSQQVWIIRESHAILVIFTTYIYSLLYDQVISHKISMTLWRSIDNSAEMRDKSETEIFYVKSLSLTYVLQWDTRMEQIPKTENIWEILCISWKEENPV